MGKGRVRKGRGKGKDGEREGNGGEEICRTNIKVLPMPL